MLNKTDVNQNMNEFDTQTQPIELLISIVREVIEISKTNTITPKELKRILTSINMPFAEVKDLVKWFEEFSIQKHKTKQKYKNTKYILKSPSNKSLRLFFHTRAKQNTPKLT